MSAKAKEGGLQRGLPPVIDIAVCQVRHYDWPSVVTAHNGLHSAMVWSAFNQARATFSGNKSCTGRIWWNIGTVNGAATDF